MPPDQPKLYTIILTKGDEKVLLGGFNPTTEKDKALRFSSIDEAVKHAKSNTGVIVQGGYDWVRVAPIIEIGYGRTVKLFEVAGGRLVNIDFIRKDARNN